MITFIDDFVGQKNYIDTCDDRIQLYWECTNSTLPSIVLEFIWLLLYFLTCFYAGFTAWFYGFK